MKRNFNFTFIFFKHFDVTLFHLSSTTTKKGFARGFFALCDQNIISTGMMGMNIGCRMMQKKNPKLNKSFSLEVLQNSLGFLFFTNTHTHVVVNLLLFLMSKSNHTDR